MMQLLEPGFASGIAVLLWGVVTVGVVSPATMNPKKYLFDPTEYFTGLGTSIVGVVETGVQTTLISAFQIAKKSLYLVPALLYMMATLGGVALLNQYDNNMIRGADQVTTKYVMPEYHSVGIPVARSGQLVFDSAVCWFDLAFSYRNILLRDMFQVLVNCEEQQWATFVNNTFRFASKLASIPVVFVMFNGEQPFAVQPALQAFADIFVSLEKAIECTCEELSFLVNMLFNIIDDSNLSKGLDRAFNTVFYYPPKIIVRSLVEIYNGIFNNNNNNTNPIDRDPKFNDMKAAYCDFTYTAGAWIDNSVGYIFDEFVDNADQFIPPIQKIVGSTFCATGGLLLDLLDLLTHIDLVFKSDVQYLRYAPINNLLYQGYNFSDGLEDFWHGFNIGGTDIPGEVGNLFGEGARTVFIAGSTTANFTISIFYLWADINSFSNFILGYNTTPISTSYGLFRQSALNISGEINDRWGKFVEQITFLVESIPTGIFHAFHDLVAGGDDIANTIQTYMLGTFQVDTNYTLNRAQSTFASFANFLRQFDDGGTCLYTDPVYPPSIVILVNPSFHTLCAFANLVEDIGMVINTIGKEIVGLVLSVYTAIAHNANTAQIYNMFLGIQIWYEGDVHTVYQNYRDNLSGFVGSFFSTVNCPCVASGTCVVKDDDNPITLSPTTIGGQVQQLMGTVTEGTIGQLFYMGDIIITMVVEILGFVNARTIAGKDLSDFLCVLAQGVMDIFGRFFAIVVQWMDFMACLIGGLNFTPPGSSQPVIAQVNLFTNWLWVLFFSPNTLPGNPSSLRNQLCVIVTFFVDAIKFIAGILTGGLSFIGQQIANFARATINQVVNDINSVIVTQINVGLQQIYGFINGDIIHYIRVVFCYASLLIDTIGCMVSQPIGNCYNTLINGLNSCNGGQSCGDVFGPLCPSFIPTNFQVPNIPNVRRQASPDYNLYLPLETDEFYGALELRQSSTINVTDYYGNDTYLSAQDKMDYASQNVNLTHVYCDKYLAISNNQSLEQNIRQYFGEEYIFCVSSVSFMTMVNSGLFYNDTGSWLPLTMLQRFGSAVNGSFMLSKLAIAGAIDLSYPLSHEIGCYSEYFLEASTGNLSLGNVSNCISWQQFYNQNNLTSVWVYRLGRFMEGVRLEWEDSWAKNNYSYGFTNFTGAILAGGNYLKTLLLDPLPGTNYTLIDSFFRSFFSARMAFNDTSIKKRATDSLNEALFGSEAPLANATKMGFNASQLLTTGLNHLARGRDWMTWRLSKFVEPGSAKALRNRAALWNIYYITSSVYKDYIYRMGLHKRIDDPKVMEMYNSYEANEDLLMSIAHMKGYPDPRDPKSTATQWLHSTPLGREKMNKIMRAQVAEKRRRNAIARDGHGGFEERTSIDDFIAILEKYFGNFTTGICGIPTIHGPRCLNCTILQKALDEMTVRVLECVQMTEININLLNNEFLAPFASSFSSSMHAVSAQTSNVYDTWFTEVAEGQVLGNGVYAHKSFESSIRRSSLAVGFFVNPLNATFTFIDDKIIVPITTYVLGYAYNFTYYENKLLDFFINTNITSDGSLFFWLQTFVNTPTTLDCGQLAQRGIGIGNLTVTFFSMIAFYVFASILMTRLSSFFTPMIGMLWATFIPIFMAVNYGVSPLVFPAVPMCIGDDLYKLAISWDVPCFNATYWLPGLTNDAGCPTNGTDYYRDWAWCSADPYYMDNPWRMIFFTLELADTRIMDFIANSQLSILVLFRSIPGMDTMVHFSYKPDPPPPGFKSCFMLRAVPNFAATFVYLTILSFVTGVTLTITLVSAAFIVQVVFYGAAILMASVHYFIGLNIKDKSLYRNPEEYINRILIEMRTNRLIDLDNLDVEKTLGDQDMAGYGDKIMSGVSIPFKKKGPSALEKFGTIFEPFIKKKKNE